MVRRRVDSDVVIVHDGVTPIDAVQVRRLWRQTRRAGVAREARDEARHQRPGRSPRDAQRDGAGARSRDGLPIARADRAGREVVASTARPRPIGPRRSRGRAIARAWARFRRCRGPIFSPRSPSSRSANNTRDSKTTCPVCRSRVDGAESSRSRNCAVPLQEGERFCSST